MNLFLAEQAIKFLFYFLSSITYIHCDRRPSNISLPFDSQFKVLPLVLIN